MLSPHGTICLYWPRPVQEDGCVIRLITMSLLVCWAYACNTYITCQANAHCISDISFGVFLLSRHYPWKNLYVMFCLQEVGGLKVTISFNFIWFPMSIMSSRGPVSWHWQWHVVKISFPGAIMPFNLLWQFPSIFVQFDINIDPVARAFINFNEKHKVMQGFVHCDTKWQIAFTSHA